MKRDERALNVMTQVRMAILRTMAGGLTSICILVASAQGDCGEGQWSHWPAEDAEWDALKNHIDGIYDALVDRVLAVDPNASTSDFEPTYLWPYHDYLKFIKTIESLIPLYVCQTNIGPDGTFNSYFATPDEDGIRPLSLPMWTIPEILEFCTITNTWGEQDWATNYLLHSWALVSHTLQVQVASAVTALIWTVQYVDFESEGRGGQGLGTTWNEAKVNCRASYDAWWINTLPPGRWTQGFGGTGSYEARAFGSSGVLRTTPLHGGVRHTVDFYTRASPDPTTDPSWIWHDFGEKVHWITILSDTKGPTYATLVESVTFGGNPFGAWVPSPPPPLTKGYYFDTFPQHALIKWDFPSLNLPPPTPSPSETLDSDRDDIVHVGVDLDSFGHDSGSIVWRADQDHPYVAIPLAAPPLWYGGLPVHAYLCQGGWTNLPYSYLLPEMFDCDGFYQAMSLNTRILQSNYFDNDFVTNKQVAVLRPRGQVVAFEFEADPDLGGFKDLGFPIGVNSNRSYILKDVTPGDHLDFNYELHFQSGVIHHYGTEDGSLIKVAHIDGMVEDVSPFDIPGGVVSLPDGATDSRYEVELDWAAGRIVGVRYSSGDETIHVLVSYDTGQRIVGLSKSGVAGIDAANVSIDGPTLTYPWGIVHREGTGPAGVPRFVTLKTMLGDTPSTVLEKFTFNADNRIVGLSVSANGGTASATFQYETAMGRYPNGALHQAKLLSATYPSGLAVSYGYDADTGWLTSQSYPVGNGSTREIEYRYDSASGDDANTAFLIERPRLVTDKYDGVPIGKTIFAYLGPTQTTVQRAAAPGATWGVDVLQTVNQYANEGAMKGLLISSVYPSGHSIYDYDGTDWSSLRSDATHSNGEMVTKEVNSFGHVVGYVVREDDHVTWSAASEGDVDAFGRPLLIEYHDGTVEERTDHGLFGPQMVVGRDGMTRIFAYDGLGQVVSVTETDLGRATQFTYDALGNVLSIAETGGALTMTHAYTFDVLSRRTSETVCNNTTWFVYSDKPYGYRKQTILPSGIVARDDDFYFDGTSKASVGALGRHPRVSEYGIDEWDRFYVKEFGGGESWSTVAVNFLGSPEEISRSGVPTQRTMHYDEAGRHFKTVDEAGRVELTVFSDRNRPVDRVWDVDRNDAVDWAGEDRIRSRHRAVGADGVVETVYMPVVQGTAASNLVSLARISLDGLRAETVSWGRTTVVERSAITGPGAFTVTTTQPDGTKTVQTYDKGRLAGVERFDVDDESIEEETYTYNELGYVVAAANSARGTTSYTYDPCMRLRTIVRPNGDILEREYDPVSGYLRRQGLDDGSAVRFDYFDDALLKRQYDGSSYDLRYDYDDEARRSRLTTRRAGADVHTDWEFDGETGLLRAKHINDEEVETYSYYPDGKLATVTNAVGVGLGLEYNAAGDLERMGWSTATPSLVFTNFDRLGRVGTKVLGEITNEYQYAWNGHTETVRYAGVGLPEATVRYDYGGSDGAMRERVVESPRLTNVLTITHDAAGRVASLANGGLSVEYGYDATGGGVAGTVWRYDGEPILDLAIEWDLVNARPQETLWSGAGFADGRTYTYEAKSGRLGRIDLADGTYRGYTYDRYGHLLTGGRYHAADDTAVPGEQFVYAYDEIGNVLAAGPRLPGGVATHRFGANDFNVHVSRVWSNRIEVIGRAAFDPAVPVFVNDVQCARRGDRFQAWVPVDNTAGAVELLLTARAVSNDVVAEVSGVVRVAKWEETPVTSPTGALAADSRLLYRFDDSGRLAEVTNLVSQPNLRVAFTYYPDGQRATKVVDVWDEVETDWAHARSHAFVYDGWNLIHEEIQAASEEAVTVREYVWGLGMAGRRDGRWGQADGGIGGLLAIREIAGGKTNLYVPLGEHNGSVFRVLDTNLVEVAGYLYSPFGALIGERGARTDLCPFRFMSKYYDPETELLYYGHRYYDPRTAKWLSRDPLGEQGGVNLTAFCRNDPVNNIDPLGLEIQIVGEYIEARVMMESVIGNKVEWKDRTLRLPTVVLRYFEQEQEWRRLDLTGQVREELAKSKYRRPQSGVMSVSRKVDGVNREIPPFMTELSKILSTDAGKALFSRKRPVNPVRPAGRIGRGSPAGVWNQRGVGMGCQRPGSSSSSLCVEWSWMRAKISWK